MNTHPSEVIVELHITMFADGRVTVRRHGDLSLICDYLSTALLQQQGGTEATASSPENVMP